LAFVFVLCLAAFGGCDAVRVAEGTMSAVFLVGVASEMMIHKFKKFIEL